MAGVLELILETDVCLVPALILEYATCALFSALDVELGFVLADAECVCDDLPEKVRKLGLSLDLQPSADHVLLPTIPSILKPLHF
jgi:hypothetical protein